MESRAKILVVDSDPCVSELIRSHCDSDGITVNACFNADDLYSINLVDYAMLIVDLAIDDNQGLNIIEQVKQSKSTASRVSVIACSTKMSPSTIINALNAGADDYLLKPFSPREMVARIHSVLRRRPA